MKKAIALKSLKQSETIDLLFSTNHEEPEPIVLLVTNNFIICDINDKGAEELFNCKKQDLINHSLINLLEEQDINVKEFLKVIKLDQNSFYKVIKLDQSLLGKKYSASIIATRETNQTYFAITLTPTNNAYIALKSYMNAIINNLPGAVYWKDREGRYMGCNKFVASMAGFNGPEEMIGKTDYDFCWHEFADEWRLLDKKVIEEDSTIVREEKAKLADGRIITELTFKTPLKNEHNEIVGIIGTSLDITERKEIEAALQQSKIAAESANQAKTEFIRNMEHQLRTPFSGVFSIVQMLFETEKEPEKKELLKLTYQSAKEFLELLNNIIEFSRNQLDSTAILSKKFDLKATIVRAVTMEKAAAVIKNLSLDYSYSKELPTIFIGDSHRILRLVLNLLGNAIKFTVQGRVSIEVKLAKKIDDKNLILQIIISDTGIGIAEEKQQYIYEKFYRLHPANQNKYKGAGLGLYVVKQIIDELEGEIDVISKPNRGTTFICTLPLKRPLLDEIITDDTALVQKHFKDEFI